MFQNITGGITFIMMSIDSALNNVAISVEKKTFPNTSEVVSEMMRHENIVLLRLPCLKTSLIYTVDNGMGGNLP